jgi:hypothetical protein
MGTSYTRKHGEQAGCDHVRFRMLADCGRCCWGLACRLIKRYCPVEDPDNPPSMQVSPCMGMFLDYCEACWPAWCRLVPGCRYSLCFDSAWASMIEHNQIAGLLCTLAERSRLTKFYMCVRAGRLQLGPGCLLGVRQGPPGGQGRAGSYQGSRPAVLGSPPHGWAVLPVPQHGPCLCARQQDGGNGESCTQRRGGGGGVRCAQLYGAVLAAQAAERDCSCCTSTGCPLEGCSLATVCCHANTFGMLVQQLGGW